MSFLVDEYHFSPHAGLGGQMPANRWAGLVREYEIKLPPGSDRIRDVFGIDLCRKSGPKGMRFAGLYYNSTLLQDWRLANGDAMLRIRVDPEDLGAISVELGGTWHEVACLLEMWGTRWKVWKATCAHLAAQYGEEAQVAAPIVHACVRAIDARIASAVALAGLSTRPTSAQMEHEAAEIRLGFHPGAEMPPQGESLSDSDWVHLIPARGDPDPAIPRRSEDADPLHSDDDDDELSVDV